MDLAESINMYVCSFACVCNELGKGDSMALDLSYVFVEQDNTHVWLCNTWFVWCDERCVKRLSLGRKWFGLLFVSCITRLRARAQASELQENIALYDFNGIMILSLINNISTYYVYNFGRNALHKTLTFILLWQPFH